MADFLVISVYIEIKKLDFLTRIIGLYGIFIYIKKSCIFIVVTRIIIMITERPTDINFKRLTNNECRKLLNETLHRMDFLRELQDDVFNFVNERILTINHDNEVDIIYNRDNDYFIKLDIHISVTINEKYMANRNPAVYYNESGLRGGKIESPKLYVNVIKNQKGNFNSFGLQTSIYHEVTHLYDDWQWIKNGHNPLCVDTNKINITGLINELISNGNGISQQVGWCLYLSRYYENNAFINQTESELSKLGCTRKNVSKKIKSTIAYRNYNKLKIDMKYYIANSSDDDFKRLNKMVIDSGLGKIVPRLVDYNVADYKNKLLKWSEDIFRRFIKRYCGVVQHYLDVNQLFEMKNK